MAAKKFKLSSWTLIIICSLSVQLLSAQDELPDKKEATAAQDKPVIVQIEVPNVKVIEKLQKKKNVDAITAYKKALEKYNVTMKAVMDKYWKFSDQILYMTPDEITTLIDSKSTEYVIIRCATTSIGTGMIHNGSGAAYNPGGTQMVATSEYGGNLNWSYTELKEENWEDDRDYWNGNTIMEFWRVEKMKKGLMKTPDVVARVALPEIFPDTASVVYGVKMVQHYLKSSLRTEKINYVQQLKADYALVRSKTVYVRSDRLDPELSEQEVKKIYTYPIRIVSKSEYETAIFNGEDGNAFIVIAPQVVALTYAFHSGGSALFNNYVFDVYLSRSLVMIGPPISSYYKTLYLGGNAGKPLANERVFEVLNKAVTPQEK
ncbi:MAG: hypothetical protein IPO83_16260 [Chitinophagaceae bacterium]|nr:hypothetical protein [Chitinophagaceae bacterium]